MDELIEFTDNYSEIQFIVNLDYNIEGYQTEQEYYSCLDWANLYVELGEFGNNPLILNGDPEHYIWHMFSGNTYSAYAFLDHNMVVRYLLDEPDLYDFQYDYIPDLLSLMYGCTDENACNYDLNAGVNDDTCLYDNQCGDINIDNSIDIFDIVLIIDLILMDDYNYIADLNLDDNIDVLDVIQILNIILE